MRDTDRYTIAHTPISSLDLMERAAAAFVRKFVELYPDRNQAILVCCGTGNNGGDGLAIARLLHERHYDHIRIWVAHFSDSESNDFRSNLKKLAYTFIPVEIFVHADELPRITEHIVIDALLGSGLNKPLEGLWLALAKHINEANRPVIAVDMPTGLSADGKIYKDWECLSAKDTISFQRPKLSFFFPESVHASRFFHVVDIGLDEDYMSGLESDYYLFEEVDALTTIKERLPFSHKGTYGHALVIAGSARTMGAALICAEACLRTGAGLTTACIPASGLIALNARLPEVMALERDKLIESELPYQAIAFGPGIGTDEENKHLLFHILQECKNALVLDADALNILAADPNWKERVPAGTIITPHMKEFDRLFGQSESWYERVQKAKHAATEWKLVVVLKNQYTFVALPDGRVIINTTGNPGMASGGMGDALTGVIVSLLAQGYDSKEAAMLGVYLHGKAGDEWAKDGYALIHATQLIQKIPMLLQASCSLCKK
ncbi:NAD(P)H-hydrate dehydratase [Olivibacter sitiensis]|uniref:NAD(P)H-hydrate dehydratase n=1 Tax=Olivibacter sitiensis TaxID=376470 RepID=UPI0004003537|nr:NAD(P)H-hydrate dehydratase [Olivibacter sitiensis]